MDTKEAIEWLNDVISDLVVGELYYPNEAKKAEDIIELLQPV